MKRCEWVEPVLVAQVKFTEWTTDDQLRQAVFMGMNSSDDIKTILDDLESNDEILFKATAQRILANQSYSDL